MGKNNKTGSVKLPEKAPAIMAEYEHSRSGSDGFLFPELRGEDLNDKFRSQRIIGIKASAIDKVLNKQVLLP